MGASQVRKERPWNGYQHRTAPSRSSRTTRARLPRISRRRRHGEVAAAARLHRQGASPRREGWRYLPDVLHELLVRPGAFLWRRVPRARAQPADIAYRSIRRSEPARRDAYDDLA